MTERAFDLTEAVLYAVAQTSLIELTLMLVEVGSLSALDALKSALRAELQAEQRVDRGEAVQALIAEGLRHQTDALALHLGMAEAADALRQAFLDWRLDPRGRMNPLSRRG